MKKLMLCIAAIFSASSAFAGWVEGSIIGVRDDNSKTPGMIWLTNYPTVNLAPGVWHRASVTTKGMPADTKSIFVSGILVITHGTSVETCDLTIAFRAPGDTMNAGNYIGQTIESLNGSGQRSNMSTWAPVVNGEIEYQWNYNTPGTWPTNCSYAINLSVQSYVR